MLIDGQASRLKWGNWARPCSEFPPLPPLPVIGSCLAGARQRSWINFHLAGGEMRIHLGKRLGLKHFDRITLQPLFDSASRVLLIALARRTIIVYSYSSWQQLTSSSHLLLEVIAQILPNIRKLSPFTSYDTTFALLFVQFCLMNSQGQWILQIQRSRPVCHLCVWIRRAPNSYGT